MSIRDELKDEVAQIFREQWTRRNGTTVPDSDALKLGNDAVLLDGTVLYADLSGSTSMVDGYKPYFAAEIYKSFLHCAARLIRYEGGSITAYDGDRIMAVFIGDNKNTAAARAALRINWARLKVIEPAMIGQYPKSTFRPKHTTTVDTSALFVARTGVRGSNDLVWVGRAANHAAKMSTLSPEFPSRVTKEVYDMMNKSAKFSSDGKNMWERITWTDTGRTIYRSTWLWSP